MNPLKKYRNTHDLTQKELADIVGVTQGCINHIECERRVASAKLCILIEKETKKEIKRASLRPDLFGDAA